MTFNWLNKERRKNNPPSAWIVRQLVIIRVDWSEGFRKILCLAWDIVLWVWRRELQPYGRTGQNCLYHGWPNCLKINYPSTGEAIFTLKWSIFAKFCITWEKNENWLPLIYPKITKTREISMDWPQTRLIFRFENVHKPFNSLWLSCAWKDKNPKNFVYPPVKD